MATVVISGRGERRLRNRHPWIYRADVLDVRAAAGDRVAVRGDRGQPLGQALYSDHSKIALRMLTFDETAADDELIERRLEEAIRFRRTLGIGGSACRLVHGEADLLPSLIVDQYGPYLVVQTLSQGMDRLTPVVLRGLQRVLEPRGILARNDPRVRLLEGLDQRVDVLAGEIPDRVCVTEAGVEYEVDLRGGQKTGLFLDQRENRFAAAGYAKGRTLDCFSYQGGFALTLARHSDETVALEVSEDAVAQLRANAARNNIVVDARVCNVFDELRRLDREGERFDTIVLDPPAFAKTKAAVPRAVAGYNEINLRGLRLLHRGGVLITCSCSYNVSEADFAEVLRSAAADARVQVTILEKRMQSRDHPVLLSVPETYYLKCFILRRL